MSRIKTLLLSGANNHDWRRSAPFVKATLKDSGLFDVTLTEDSSAALEDNAALAGYQLLFSDYNGPHWSDKANANFESAVASGVGLVVMHAADNAFRGWVEYEKMVGLLWRDGTGHGQFQEIGVKITDKDHPITRGVSDFGTWDELYHRLVHMHDGPYHVLATAWSNPEKGGTGNDEPVMVVTHYGKGRVYHHVLGHVWEGGDMRAFENDGFKQALTAAASGPRRARLTIDGTSSRSDVVRVVGLAAVMCAAGAGELRASRGTGALGLQVNAQGVLLKDGKPYRGVGVNCVSAFCRVLLKPEDTSYKDSFKTLAKLKIPFMRFAACGFWPRDNQLYLKDKAAYFKLLDGVIKCAEENGIGLIPSFFWLCAMAPDLVGEPVDQWGNPQSKTIKFMREYTREIVTRYRSSPAIWGWEFGNEFDLAADLPNAAEHRPYAQTSLGTPASRSKRDDLTHAMIWTAFVEFAREVRKYDKRRVIFTGNAFPRASAWHQRKELSWTNDSEEQYAEMLLADNPDPMDTVTVHLYDVFLSRFNRKLTDEELLRVTMRAATKAKKPLFVGEFGVPVGKDAAVEKETFLTMLKAIEQTGVPLAAIWVYDYGAQSDDWNITATNARSYQLTAISELNKRLRGSGSDN